MAEIEKMFCALRGGDVSRRTKRQETRGREISDAAMTGSSMPLKMT